MVRRFKSEKNFPLHQFSDQVLEDTIAFWQPHSPHRKLTQEDGREIIENITGFFQVLRDWDEKERAEDKMAEKPRPLTGLEPKRRIISTSGSFIQTFEMQKVWVSNGVNWKVW